MGPQRPLTGSIVAAVGTTTRGTCVLRIATGIRLATVTTTSASAS